MSQQKQRLSKSRKSGKVADRSHPIAKRLIGKMKQYAGSKVIDLGAFAIGRAHAEDLQKTIASREELAGFHPAHAAYVYAQNQISVMSEQLTALDEMEWFAQFFSKAEDEYMSSGPPWSPLTPSFYTSWAFFDVCGGPAEETIGRIVMAVGAAFGTHTELLRVIGLMQESRMGIYVCERMDADAFVFREMVTEDVFRAIVPSGYRGRTGELWYARVLPPPFPGATERVVFTTPYILLHPAQPEWQAYFRRNLPEAPSEERIAAYKRHMKYGPARQYWTEFVFKAYLNHRTDAIFLAGLPDVPENRPNSSVHLRW